MNYFPAKEAPEPAFVGTDASFIIPYVFTSFSNELKVLKFFRAA